MKRARAHRHRRRSAAPDRYDRPRSGRRGRTVRSSRSSRSRTAANSSRRALDGGGIVDPQRLTTMMDQVLEHRQEWNDRRHGHIAELRKRVAEAEAKLKRLYEAIENGVINAADPSLKDRIAELSAIRDQAHADAERAAAAPERVAPAITPESLRRFALSARRKLRNEDGTYRRDHLRAVAQRVEVVSPTEIRILGTKTELLRTLVAAAGVESAAAGVPSFVPKWRARRDSNS
jgi:site-specific DNA recombinase